jgi:sterol desaturase/sphingolipid hydroxylase (fatty acid hydroxylase superfamily)
MHARATAKTMTRKRTQATRIVHLLELGATGIFRGDTPVEHAIAGWTFLVSSLEWLVERLLGWPKNAPLVPSLLVPVVGVILYALVRPRRLFRFRWRRTFRALISLRYFAHRSHRLDLMLAACNMGLFALIVSQAVISMALVSNTTLWSLDTMFGATAPSTFSPLTLGLIWFAALFLTYEFAYWLDHKLCHTIPALWEFHKVHHSAEVLSPLTNYRVHPVDSIVFMNIVMICNGLVIGTLHHILGGGHVALESFALATVVSLGLTVLAQMQHSHVWLPFTGWLGRILLSPAHHQIHHSTDPAHHNKNMGNFIAIFDWAAGTLHVPSKKRPKLVFGVDGFEQPHDFTEAMVKPFVDSARHIMPKPDPTFAKPNPTPQT